jgi:hypothetical protein
MESSSTKTYINALNIKLNWLKVEASKLEKLYVDALNTTKTSKYKSKSLRVLVDCFENSLCKRMGGYELSVSEFNTIQACIFETELQENFGAKINIKSSAASKWESKLVQEVRRALNRLRFSQVFA